MAMSKLTLIAPPEIISLAGRTGKARKNLYFRHVCQFHHGENKTFRSPSFASEDRTIDKISYRSHEAPGGI